MRFARIASKSQSNRRERAAKIAGSLHGRFQMALKKPLRNRPLSP